jgi:hypothetical protein
MKAKNKSKIKLTLSEKEAKNLINAIYDIDYDTRDECLVDLCDSLRNILN